ncbi:MAG: glycosyltransferase [Chthoniobacterales bacterium]
MIAESSPNLGGADERRPLSIVHLNAHDHYGGAEQVMRELIASQRRQGNRSLALVGHKARADSPALAFALDPDRAREKELLRAGWPDYQYRGSHRLTSHPAVREAEVMHAHNLYGDYFHPFSLIALSQARPFIWTIHDMQALTGYCSHSLDCERWETGCGECPDLGRPGPPLAFDNTAALWRDKQLISENSRLFLVGGSEWIVSKLKRSLHARHPIHLIPNGVDTTLFRPSDRAAVRRKLGLPPEALIVGSLAGGGVFAHPWKGGTHARAVVDALRARHPTMLFLNIGATETAEPWIRALAANSREELCEILGALDFFLHPSIADTAPLAVLEAMACGLPIVGFRVGGIPDFVSAENGILVGAGNSQALVEAACQLADDPLLRAQLGAASRERAVKLFGRERMVASYDQLYREAIAACGGARPDGDTANAATLGEIHRVQAEIVGLEHALREHRARRKTIIAELIRLLDNRWIRLGLRLGLIRGPVKNWLRREERARAKRLAKDAG